MRIYYQNNKIVSTFWNKDRAQLLPIEYPFIDIDETVSNVPVLLNVVASMIIDGEDSLYTIIGGALSYQDVPVTLDTDIDKQAIRDAYVNMIARLEQIQAASNPTNAQIVQAIKDEALYIERVMKVIKTLVT